MFDGHFEMILARLGVATLLGLAIGFEREWRGLMPKRANRADDDDASSRPPNRRGAAQGQ